MLEQERETIFFTQEKLWWHDERYQLSVIKFYKIEGTICAAPNCDHIDHINNKLWTKHLSVFNQHRPVLLMTMQDLMLFNTTNYKLGDFDKEVLLHPPYSSNLSATDHLCNNLVLILRNEQYSKINAVIEPFKYLSL